MTSFNKARELITEFIDYTDDNSFTEFNSYQNAKHCALICVNEIYRLNDLKVGRYEGEKNTEMYYSYWEEVKEELNKL